MSFDRWEGFTFFQLVDFSLLRDGEGLMDEKMSFRRFFSTLGWEKKAINGRVGGKDDNDCENSFFYDDNGEDEEAYLIFVTCSTCGTGVKS